MILPTVEDGKTSPLSWASVLSSGLAPGFPQLLHIILVGSAIASAEDLKYTLSLA